MNKHKMIAINGMPDHIHILIGFRTTQSMGELIQVVKANSSKWINDKEFCDVRFEWQKGFGVFSYSKSSLPNVIRYIENQKTHHAKKPFLKEYKETLEKNEVDYDERFIFQDPE